MTNNTDDPFAGLVQIHVVLTSPYRRRHRDGCDDAHGRGARLIRAGIMKRC